MVEFSLFKAEMHAGQEDFIHYVTVLKEVVEHHVKEEESAFFKMVEKAFDDSLAARTTLPQLTTVRQPLRMMGMKAVESLLARIRQHQGQADHTEPKPIVFPVEVVVRASVRDIAAKK